MIPNLHPAVKILLIPLLKTWSPYYLLRLSWFLSFLELVNCLELVNLFLPHDQLNSHHPQMILLCLYPTFPRHLVRIELSPALVPCLSLDFVQPNQAFLSKRLFEPSHRHRPAIVAAAEYAVSKQYFVYVKFIKPILCIPALLIMLTKIPEEVNLLLHG